MNWGEEIYEEVSGWSYLEWASVVALMYPLLRAVLVTNLPTYDDGNKSENHANRIKTALFYVPFVPLTAVFVPRVFMVFLATTVWVGSGEVVQALIAPRESREAAAKDAAYEPGMMDRLYQALCTGHLVLVYALGRDGLAIGLALSMAVLVVSYMLYLMLDGRARATSGAAVELPPRALEHLAVYLFGFLWVAWAISHTVLVYQFDSPFPGGWICTFLLTSWFGDAAAYYVGSRYGRTRAMPSVSPNKSVEGVIAEFVFTTFLVIVCKLLQTRAGFFFLPDTSLLHYIVLALICSGAGIIGDALESLVKRVGHVKDSGRFFPGHGGVLDRFDSFFMIGIILYYYIAFVPGVLP